MRTSSSSSSWSLLFCHYCFGDLGVGMDTLGMVVFVSGSELTQPELCYGCFSRDFHGSGSVRFGSARFGSVRFGLGSSILKLYDWARFGRDEARPNRTEPNRTEQSKNGYGFVVPYFL